MTPRHWLPFLLTALLALAGCGGGGGDSDSPPPPVETAPIGPPVTQTVGAAGGAVQLTASGMKLSITIPDGALSADTVLTLTPQAPAAGEVARVKLAPGGLFFAKPVTVVLEYPAGQLPATTASLRQRLGSDDSFMVTTVDTARRTLTARLTTFGGTGMDVLARLAATSVPAGRAQVLSVRLDTPATPGDGSLSATSTTPLADIVASIRRQTTILENAGDFDAAFALQASVASLLNRRGDVDFGTTATPFLREAHDTACLALVSAIAETRRATITTATDFAPLRKKAGQWWMIAEQMDFDRVGCARASIDDFTQAALALTQRELAFHKGKFQAANLPSLMNEPASGVKASRRNKREIEALEAAAAALDLPPLPPQSNAMTFASARVRPLAVRPTGLASMIQTELLDPLVTPAREAAWTVAKYSNSLAPYPTLVDSFGGMPVLAQDAQFVRTRVEVRINNASGELLNRSVLGFDTVPDRPAEPKRSDTLTVRTGGTLAISGNIANLECASAGDETLKLSFDNVELTSLTAGGGNLLAGALSSFTRARLLQAAGLPEDDTGSHQLRIRRSTSPCAATLGITDDLLAAVTLNFSEPLVVTVTEARADCTQILGPSLGTATSQAGATDLSFPLQFSSPSQCGNPAHTMSLRLLDANTLEWAVDFDATNVPPPGDYNYGTGEYNGSHARDVVSFDVVVPRAGTVTVTANAAWIADPQDCYDFNATTRTANDQDMLFDIYRGGNQRSRVGYSPCDLSLQSNGYRPTDSFPVAAGDHLQASLMVLNTTGKMRGTGAAFTLRFVPAQ